MRLLLKAALILGVVSATTLLLLVRWRAGLPTSGACLHLIRKDGLVGVVDGNGSMVANPAFQGGDCSSTYAALWSEDRIVFVDRSGQIVFETQGPGHAEFIADEIAAIYSHSGDSLDLVNLNTRSLLNPPPGLKRIGEVDELGRFPFKLGESWGFLDRDLAVSIPAQFGYAYGYSEGVAAVSDMASGTWGYLCPKGKWVIDPTFEGAMPFSRGVAMVTQAGELKFIDSSGRILSELPPLEAAMPAFDGGIPIKPIDKGWGVCSPDGGWILEPNLHRLVAPSEGLLGVQDGSGWRFIDLWGRTALALPTANSIGPFRCGLAEVRTGRTTALVNRHGDVVWESE